MSTCAYQGYARGLDLNMIETVNHIATTGLKPDLTLVFLMSDKYFSSRGEYLFSDRLEREDQEFRQNMRQGYKKPGGAHGKRVFDRRRCGRGRYPRARGGTGGKTPYFGFMPFSEVLNQQAATAYLQKSVLGACRRLCFFAGLRA